MEELIKANKALKLSEQNKNDLDKVKYGELIGEINKAIDKGVTYYCSDNVLKKECVEILRNMGYRVKKREGYYGYYSEISWDERKTIGDFILKFFR